MCLFMCITFYNFILWSTYHVPVPSVSVKLYQLFQNHLAFMTVCASRHNSKMQRAFYEIKRNVRQSGENSEIVLC